MRTVHSKPIMVLMGPTGAGKSALALAIAQARPTVIINADAMQMVDGLRVLTARPSVAEEAVAEHALYGVLRVEEPTSVALWLTRVEPVIRRAWAEGKLPLLVGGTGMYLTALMHGLAEVPPIPAAIRAQARTHPSPYAALAEHDPLMAARLKPGDTQRVLRALEVILATGTSLATWQARQPAPLFPEAAFTVFALTHPRAEIYRRIDARFLQMMEQGALAEVESMVQNWGMDLHNPPPLTSLPPIFRAHGVPELMAYLRGALTLTEAIAQGQQHTRNYAKRQMTWLRNQMPDAVPVQHIEEIEPYLSPLPTT